MLIAPKNWDEFQHYKKRNPPWIRLYRKLVDDYKFQLLPVESRALAPQLWLLASEYEGGKITASPRELVFRLRQSDREIYSGLLALLTSEFFIADQEFSDECIEWNLTNASAMQATCNSDATPETETETEAEAEAESKPRGYMPTILDISNRGAG